MLVVIRVGHISYISNLYGLEHLFVNLINEIFVLNLIIEIDKGMFFGSLPFVASEPQTIKKTPYLNTYFRLSKG